MYFITYLCDTCYLTLREDLRLKVFREQGAEEGIYTVVREETLKFIS
jgi:hypothetical protein